MYCPKCGTENPEGAQLCRSCSWVLTSISTVAPSPDAKTSGLAITSLVLGILSIFTLFLTALPAIILGIISIFKIEKSAGQLKGKGLAIAGIAIPAISIFLATMMLMLLAILMPALARAKAQAQRVVCAKNMSVLGKAMLIYANDYDNKFPTSSEWCDLLIKYADVNEGMFRCGGAFGCRSTRCYKGVSGKLCSYAMNKNIAELGTKALPDMVLLFETSAGWNQAGGLEILSTNNHRGEGCNILFADLHVQFVKPEDIKNLKWTAEQKK
jgi:prepilin-type processing-associated H-X9-DG protein